MITGDPNVAIVEVVAEVLSPLCEQVVLVGGCAASLLIDAPSAPPPRVTTDVDLIAEVTSLSDCYALEQRFAQQGLARDLTPDAPICLVDSWIRKASLRLANKLWAHPCCGLAREDLSR